MTHNIRGLDTPVSNQNIIQLYGEVTPVADVETLISPIGGAAPSFPSNSGELIRIDTATAVGKVRVVGLGTDFKYQSEVVVSTGVALNTTKLFTRINDLEWLEPAAFAADISATNIAGTTTYRIISAVTQLSNDGFYSVAADKKWQVVQIYAGMIKDANQQTAGYASIYYVPVFSTGNGAPRRAFRFPLSLEGQSNVSYTNLIPEEGSGPTDFYLTTAITDNTTEVVARLSILTRQA